MKFTRAGLEAMADGKFFDLDQTVEVLELFRERANISDTIEDYIYVDGKPSKQTFIFVCVRVTPVYAYFGLKQKQVV